MSASKRLSLDRALTQLIESLVRASPDKLGHVKVQNILVLAGAARRGNRASIRPLKYAHKDPVAYRKPTISIDGVPILYEICLRPLFFLEGSAKDRIQTIAHELWHISKKFDGSLEESRKHENVSDELIHTEISKIVNACQIATEIYEILSHSGELRIRSWKIRPPSRIPKDSNDRLIFDENDLFENIVIQANSRKNI
jgi:hypothetical protein